MPSKYAKKTIGESCHVFFDVINNLKNISPEESKNMKLQMNKFHDYVITVDSMKKSEIKRLKQSNQTLAAQIHRLRKKLTDIEVLMQKSLPQSNANQQNVSNSNKGSTTSKDSKNKLTTLGWKMICVIILLSILGYLLLYKIHAEIARYLDRHSKQKKQYTEIK
ncbi:hypothetical protein AB837_00082 [bacterium AB1]|nr:hypothetical protein AB837_00082 [bacterium AB1]